MNLHIALTALTSPFAKGGRGGIPWRSTLVSSDESPLTPLLQRGGQVGSGSLSGAPSAGGPPGTPSAGGPLGGGRTATRPARVWRDGQAHPTRYPHPPTHSPLCKRGAGGDSLAIHPRQQRRISPDPPFPKGGTGWERCPAWSALGRRSAWRQPHGDSPSTRVWRDGQAHPTRYPTPPTHSPLCKRGEQSGSGSLPGAPSAGGPLGGGHAATRQARVFGAMSKPIQPGIRPRRLTPPFAKGGRGGIPVRSTLVSTDESPPTSLFQRGGHPSSPSWTATAPASCC